MAFRVLCWFFLNQGDAGAVGYWDEMLNAGCDVPPPQAGTGGYEEHHWSPPDKDELPSSHQLCCEPGALGEEGQPGWFWVG